MGCGGTRDSHHRGAAGKSVATALCYHDKMDQGISEEYLKNIVEFMPRRIKSVWKTKGVLGSTQYYQAVPNNVASKCICYMCLSIGSHFKLLFVPWKIPGQETVSSIQFRNFCEWLVILMFCELKT